MPLALLEVKLEVNCVPPAKEAVAETRLGLDGTWRSDSPAFIDLATTLHVTPYRGRLFEGQKLMCLMQCFPAAIHYLR